LSGQTATVTQLAIHCPYRATQCGMDLAVD
jgi:hypothetical protein